MTRQTPKRCDLVVLSLATTPGLRRADSCLAEDLEALGVDCEVVRTEIGTSRKLRHGAVLTDSIEAWAARRSLAGALANVRPRAVVFSSVTSAMLHPRGVWSDYRTAIRFDSPATLNRPGALNAIQHRLERRAFAAADLLLPWGEIAMKACGNRGKSVILPPPVDVDPGPARRDRLVVAYAGNPRKRGLDILISAWEGARLEGVRLVVTGIDGRDALKWLRSRGVEAAENVEYTGLVERERFLELLREAHVFVNASRWEDFGIAQLEALAAGTLLVTVPSPGANEALPLARRLAPELVVDEVSASALAQAVRVGLEYGGDRAVGYRKQARELLEPFRPDRVRRTLKERVLPRLLG